MNLVIRTAAVAAAAVGVLALTACDPSGGSPTEVATPAIVWEPAEPSGGLYDDPYVSAAFAATLGFVLASNEADFTIAQLTDTTTASRIDEIYRAHVSDHGDDNRDPLVWAGPLPRTPISVTEHSDGAGADVLVCAVSSEWYISEDHPEPTTDGVEAMSLTLVIVDDNGTLKLDEVRGGEGACDPSDIALGRFDPEPVPEAKTVRRPLSAD